MLARVLIVCWGTVPLLLLGLTALAMWPSPLDVVLGGP